MLPQVSLVIAWLSSLTNLTRSGSAISLVALPLFLDGAIDWITDKIPWPPFDFFAAFQNVVEWFLNLLVTGFLDAIGLFFVTGVEYFLFYENPRHIDALNEYWMDSLVLYVFIVFAMMFAYYVMLMLLADTEDAEVQRIVERLILSGLFLFISREVFGFFVALTNEMAKGILPQDYSFYMAVEMLNVVSTSASVTMTALFIAIFGGLGILVSGVIFYIALAMRMILIYVVYAIMPVLLGLWVVDVGPGKYGKFFADLLIKLAAVMMVLGIVIAGILAVGASFGDPAQDNPGVEMASDYDTADDGTIVLSTDPNGPDSKLSDDARGGELASNALGDVIFSIFMFIGSIWLVMAVITSLAGMLLSAGAGSPGGAGGFSGHRGGGGAAQGAGPGGAGGTFGGEYNGYTSGSAHAYQFEDGRVAVANPAGGGVMLDPNAGQFEPSRQSFGPEDNPLASAEAPVNPFNTTPADPPPTLGEKASHVGGEIGDKLDDLPGPSVTDKVDGAKSYLGGAAQRVNEAIPPRVKKAGNLAKRGGKAYKNVFMQPDIGSSVGEARRIARESPIGHPGPTGEDSPTRDGPVIAHGPEAFDMGRTAGQSAVDPTETGGVDPTGTPETDSVPDPTGSTGSGFPGDDTYVEGDHSELNQDGVADEVAYKGRGPELPNDGEYGPAPEVTDYDSANHNVIHNESINTAENLAVEGYEDLNADDVISELEQSADKLSQFGVDPNTDFSREQIEYMLEHQQKMGVPADLAAQRTAESMLNASADPVGGLYTDQEAMQQLGVEDLPSELATDAPARRINLGKEGTGGVHGDHMWRIERNDGSVVYAQDTVWAKDAGVNSVMTEEVIRNSGGVAPKHHYDAAGRVIRSEGIEGTDLYDLKDGKGNLSPEDIDRESFVDAYASMGLAGHNDCHAGNVIVQDDGQVVPIDYDFAASDPSRGTPQALREAEKQAEELGMDVSQEEIGERMEEMADTYLDNVDSTKEVIDQRIGSPAENVDDEIMDQYSENEYNTITQQIGKEREFAKERAERMHEGIEKVANGKTDWQERMRGDNVIEDSASQSDVEDALEDIGLDSSGGSSTADQSDSTTLDENSQGASDDDVNAAIDDALDGFDSL